MMRGCLSASWHHPWICSKADWQVSSGNAASRRFYWMLLWWEEHLALYFHVLLPAEFGVTWWRLWGGKEDSGNFMISWFVSMALSNELCYAQDRLDGLSHSSVLTETNLIKSWSVACYFEFPKVCSCLKKTTVVFSSVKVVHMVLAMAMP